MHFLIEGGTGWTFPVGSRQTREAIEDALERIEQRIENLRKQEGTHPNAKANRGVAARLAIYEQDEVYLRSLVYPALIGSVFGDGGTYTVDSVTGAIPCEVPGCRDFLREADLYASAGRRWCERHLRLSRGLSPDEPVPDLTTPERTDP